MDPSAFVTCFQLLGAQGNDANDEETVVHTVHADHTQRMKGLQVMVSLAIGTMEL